MDTEKILKMVKNENMIQNRDPDPDPLQSLMESSIIMAQDLSVGKIMEKSVKYF